MGGGARFRMGIAFSAIGEGLREAARDFGWASLRGVCLPLSPAGSGHPPHRFITPSRAATPPIHPASGKGYSAKLDFRFTEIYEVRRGLGGTRNEARRRTRKQHREQILLRYVRVRYGYLPANAPRDALRKQAGFASRRQRELLRCASAKRKREPRVKRESEACECHLSGQHASGQHLRDRMSTQELVGAGDPVVA